jgi:hypothetical protein
LNVEKTSVVDLDGAELNDFPARYSVPSLQPYEFAAVGVWIHPNIVPGFKYKVRPIEEKEVSLNSWLFIKKSLYNDFYLFSEHDSYLIREHWN